MLFPKAAAQAKDVLVCLVATVSDLGKLLYKRFSVITQLQCGLTAEHETAGSPSPAHPPASYLSAGL